MMVCRYCGVETGSGVGHRSQSECIQALSAEIARARRIIDAVKDPRAKHDGTNEPPPAHHDGPVRRDERDER